jgi:small subunit ribosomal protein S1
VIKKGQRVDAWVLRCERDRKRLGLTLKDPAYNPWQVIKDAFPVGTRVRAKVVRVVEFGIFIQLAKGFDGLVHISDFSWGNLNQPPSAFFAAGQEVDAMVLEVDVERGRANLGIKQLTEDTSPSLDDAFSIDQVLSGTVTSLQSYGAFVRIGSGVEGLIHVSAMGKGVSNPEAVVKPGQAVSVKVVAIDADAGRIGLALMAEDTGDVAEESGDVAEESGDAAEESGDAEGQTEDN